MNKVFFVCVFLLIGCSQPTVHLNSRYLNEEQTKQVTDIVTAHGIDVKVNDHPFPQQVTNSTLIHSPTMIVRNPERIEQIQNVLKSIGWDLQTMHVLTQSNHRFTKNNLGLFLVPEGITVGSGRSAADLAHTYQSLECADNYQVTLYFDGRFQFEGENLNSLSFNGNWQLIEYPYIRLFQKEPHLNFYYQVEQTQTMDRLGSVHIITLKPMSKSPRVPDCVLEYGIRA